MKIALIANYKPSGQQSMLRFASLLERLLNQNGHEVKVLRPQPIFGKLLSPFTLVNKWLGYIDQYLIFPSTLGSQVDDSDVVHICDHSNAIYLPRIKHRPYIITCHDLIAIRSARGLFPQKSTGLTGRILQEWITKNLQQTQALVCVSIKTHRDFISLFKRNPKIITTIYSSLQYPYRPISHADAQERLLSLELAHINFFIHVGGNQWYKNRSGALQIFHALTEIPEFSNHHIIMVGEPFPADLHNYIHTKHLKNRVHELVNLPNEDLLALYNRAEALIFPSLAEGAGWPPIEAQACGCPAIISDIPPLNEISIRSAAIFINPQNIPNAVIRIRTGLQNRDALIQSGFANAERYSERNMLIEYIDVYKKAISLFNMNVQSQKL